MKLTPMELFKSFQVSDCVSVKDFVEKYYKHDRLYGRGRDYGNLILTDMKKLLEAEGICWIAPHESISGNLVSFIKKGVK